MTERPYVVLSAAISLDGYRDDASGHRLVLSNPDDLDRVDAERARSDAVLVGAQTIRSDNPRLCVREPARRAARRARGRTGSPTKVTVTGRAKLDADAAFFTSGDGAKLVYCAADTVDAAREVLEPVATVIDAGQPVDLRWMLADLSGRGVRRLFVEGGATVHTDLLAAGLADELQLVVAPLFVGDARARRFLDDAAFPWHAGRRAELAEARAVGDVVLLRYALSSRFTGS